MTHSPINGIAWLAGRPLRQADLFQGRHFVMPIRAVHTWARERALNAPPPRGPLTVNRRLLR